MGKWRKKEDVEVGPRVDDKIVNDLLLFRFNASTILLFMGG